MYRHVELGKSIKGQELINALSEAAELIGKKTITRDNYIKKDIIKLNESYIQEEQIYDCTDVILLGKGIPLPFAVIMGINKKKDTNWFEIRTGFDSPLPYFGVGKTNKIKKYLNEFSKVIKEK